MEVRQVWWRKWEEIRLPKMVGQTLELYYLFESDTDQLFLKIKYFILEEREESEL